MKKTDRRAIDYSAVKLQQLGRVGYNPHISDATFYSVMHNLESYRSLNSRLTENSTEYELYEYQDLVEKELLLREFLDFYSNDVAFFHPKIDGVYTDFIVTGRCDDELGKMTIKMDAMGFGDEMPRLTYVCAEAMSAFKK